MALTYLTLEQAIDVHRKTVDVSGGGALGHLELGTLEGVLAHIQNDDYYPTFEEKLTHLFFSACKFHCFQDGNKRIAITLCAQMLLLNGYLYCASSFLREMENISYHVAAGNIDKALLHDLITAHLAEESDDESLKLRVLNAIENAAGVD
ncbi:MAG: type II toxin-antitoxin system death-on-curing family toxin [Candidatus Accumulibacter sp.]|uniref:Type II toxin-antitoxin system death-on-curing family toxin n=1 Tax=Candidatus Accumulibacter affinis TaxID=2954384 RepID=A0A935TEN1_9PROT|nr:type II toxin-antitoxin system death-on-curing family toxin [Candidatus Accumulibacter affinis]